MSVERLELLPVKTIQAARDQYWFLAAEEKIGGQYTSIEACVAQGGPPPAHIYTREEEAIYLLEGKLTFYRAYNEIRVGPGDYLNIPK